jgi:hypothetical protein
MSAGRRWSAVLAALMFLTVLLPPVKHGLESSMSTQMLVFMPLLVGVGVLLRAALPAGVLQRGADWDYRGVTGLVLASITAAFWMVPRLLDSAVAQPAVDAARYLSLPLLIGLPFSVSWPRMSFIVRGVFLLECIATLFRMGWLYLIWPDRLCNSYLLDDQQRLGQYLILIGVAACFAIGAQLLYGHFEPLAEAPRIGARR